MSQRPQQASSRADRILDAAGTLLLRMGYRKVTIEDIAKQADIGKGTVYLHWRSKEQLFQALLRRESIVLVEQMLSWLREDPAEIRPHRFIRSSFLATHQRPLTMALVAGNVELLGKLREGAVGSKEQLVTGRFFEVLTRHGLLRADVPNVIYAMRATSAGFYLLGTVDAAPTGLDVEARADALAHTIRHAFEPAGEPRKEDIAQAAAELSAVFEDLITCYRNWIYAAEPG
ncbi:TetR/AcrR family transcriptional regulator [Polyangium sp. y55x31]|uniref:TetR/AcrR family transcriptional regulator n=1 Tax=Polyangium sp. y55x31 TaxID=3042688 RepID=UPI0024821D01|nr:TetR/AcrR family transcriptional regulator [Polyangium sp. y55x31]MDI1480322.1 TetR/AcrR family transcriptional regulator [Polyangium sp. y55x31]